MRNVLGMLKGKSKFETFERCLIASLILGTCLLSLGIGLTIITPKGVPALLAMFGSFLAFISTVLLVFVWFFEELKG